MNTTHAPLKQPKPPHNQALGARGEALAEQFLIEQGFRLIDKNWRCRYGELDLLMRDGDSYVAVEVKTRTSVRYGTPLEAITAQKASRLRRLLLEWIREHGVRGAKLRVDGVGVIVSPDGSEPRIDHLRGIS